ncbi:MAG: imidazolonepropionase [Frankiaceae bacterium]|nr:imidazolonepropionase [Frankiaceae bacterium]MBV9871830.1 imidazolonepropionase [Frankiaceae bacterium]
MSDLVVRHVGRLTTWAGPRLSDAAVVISGGVVEWTGADRDLPTGLSDRPELDAEGRAAIPGFVDCHTHAVWAGSRRDDVAGRLSGTGYNPAGIAATVAATREASYDDLLAAAALRLTAMRDGGTTTVEIKSGYGLTSMDEARLLTVGRDAAAGVGLTAMTTYLGAHVVPQGREHAEYVDSVIADLPLAAAAGAQWCDVFCDDGAFTIDDARRILIAAGEQGLGTRIHAEQLTNTGAARLAADLRCASADHLDHVTAADAAAMAAAGVVGVLVPVASLYTRSQRWSHAALLRDAGVTLAVATDCNPGTAWCESMPYAVQLACLAMGLSIDEALRAATLGGAAALRRTDVGHLSVGARGDLAVLASDHEVDVVAHLGANAVWSTVIGGQPRRASAVQP